MAYKLSILATCFFVTGLSLVVWIFIQTLKSLSNRRITAQKSRKAFAIWKIGFFVGGILMLVSSQGLFWVASNISAYAPVDTERPVASIIFEQPNESDPMMILGIRDGATGRLIPTEIVMHSDIAVLEIETIEFPEFFEILDLDQVYRISAVRFLDDSGAPLERMPSKKIQEGAESLWSFFNSVSGFIPLAKTAKIVSDPIYFGEDTRVNVYASVSRIVISEYTN